MAKRFYLACAVASCSALAAGSANAVIIGFDNGENFDYAGFTQSTTGGGDPADWSPGDWFGWGAYGAWPQAAGVPFALADDSVEAISGSQFSGDTQGIVDSTRAADDQFFGVVDTVNGNNDGGTATAVWSFDIAGFENIIVSALFAAMGDFESPGDLFDWTYSIDGGPSAALFGISVEETLSQTYTMENGVTVDLNDPLAVGGTLLDDVERLFSAPIAGAGSVLEISFEASANGGSEAFLFDNLTVEGERTVAEPTSLALLTLGLAGAGYARRRRA